MPPATDVTQSTPLIADVDAVDVTAVDVKVIIILFMLIAIYKAYYCAFQNQTGNPMNNLFNAPSQ